MGRFRPKGNLSVVTDKGVLHTGLSDKTMAVLQSDVVALVVQTVGSLQLEVILGEVGSEAPFLGHNNVLGTSELV